MLPSTGRQGLGVLPCGLQTAATLKKRKQSEEAPTSPADSSSEDLLETWNKQKKDRKKKQQKQPAKKQKTKRQTLSSSSEDQNDDLTSSSDDENDDFIKVDYDNLGIIPSDLQKYGNWNYSLNKCKNTTIQFAFNYSLNRGSVADTLSKVLEPENSMQDGLINVCQIFKQLHVDKYYQLKHSQDTKGIKPIL